ncbi:hypothetical protein [Chryseobacterium sp. MP_3.2]|uniref:hypothetical protein n=1 Tax=Chryseobacterium sp. MP_3.2 TaxID=3071712 RepID=UPI002DFFDB06|nr:hypothetical protein [Chryseobacterium sp. MP_3.2]
MSKFPIDQHQIFAATNGGLDLIQRFLDFKDVNKHFKIRKEGTESANISRIDGIYFVKDWGEASGFFKDSKHGIHIYAHYTNRTYFEALLELGKELGLIDEKKTAVKNISSCKFHELTVELNEDNFTYETKDFTDYELEVLGPLVTQEICQKHGLYSLKSYSWLKSDELKQKELCDVYTVTSSETYPIFGFIITDQAKPKLTLEGKDKTVKVEQPKPAKTWVKIYQPKSSDKKYRFSYLGKKPKQHIFGLENLKSTYNKMQVVHEDNLDDESLPILLNKIDRVIICSGDRDSLNMASTGEIVVWFNSETAEITESQIGMLFKYAREIINVPDLDPTGFDTGKKLALEHLDIKTAWLPESLTKRKDFRGSPMKDFTDFMKVNAKFDDALQIELKSKVKRFLELSRPGRFWTEKKRVNKEGRIVGEPTYTVNYKNAFNFLKLNGFSRIKDENRKDGYYFVQQDKHILREVSAQEIKDFFNQFLDLKQHEKGLRYFPDDLLNMLIGSEAVSDKKLINLPTKDFDFTDHTANSQYLFFDKFIWEVTKDEVTEINKGYSRYVMEKDILNNIIKKQTRHELDSSKIKIEANYRIDGKITTGNPFFTIKKDDNNNFDLTIHRKDCDFMNYMVNTSRVFWKEEIKELGRTQREEYLQDNRFIIDNYKKENAKTGLNDDQVYEQELHFVNKVYSFGYMLHRYKDPSKAWALYIMDNEVVDDNESHGRTGKSLFSNNALRLFMNSKYLGARKKGLLESDFLYDGVTDQTDYVLFDDADKRFPFQQLFTDITGDLNVNPKNQNAYLIPFHQSPKFCITTNYAPFGLDTSTSERILFCAFSDWYHGESDDFVARTPMDDFSKRFFTEWDDVQWNLFLNFSVQCLQFYLQSKNKIGAPSGNIKKRNLISEMGPVFLEWAEDYFRDKMNKFVVKKEALESLISYNKAVQFTSATLFKSKVRQFCELNGYEFCPNLPDEKKDKEGRFMKWHNSKSEEHFYLKETEESEEEKETTQKGIHD